MLSQTHRNLTREWHPTKNVPLTPKDVSHGSHKKVWWICKKSHEWEASISNRAKGIGCPYCAGQKASKERCLQTRYPQLARQWHPTKNAPLTPKDVAPHSGKRAWWMCSKGHEWDAVISNRSYGMGCPCCAGRKAAPDNCLQTVNPRIAREWHPTKNTPLTPRNVFAGSNKKAWWQCEKGHEWQAAIGHRHYRGTRCPYCTGNKASRENCLEAMQPELSRQWHPARNAELTPKDVTASAGKKVWWQCEKGHEWQARIYSRTAGYGCPFCAGQRVTKANCLQTAHPSLAKEWHPTKNAPLTPKDVIYGSNKRVWWRCRKGHEWKTKINHRSCSGSACPYCAGKKAAEDNCLRTVNSRLAREWHPTQNAPLTPGDVTACSGKKVWWKCQKGHEWQSEIAKRTYGDGCPFCSGHRASKENCLETKGPWLAREWHPTKNGSWSPKDVAPYSQRLVWWKCKKGHEARESVCSRAQRGGCPVCVLKRKAPRLFERVSCRS